MLTYLIAENLSTWVQQAKIQAAPGKVLERIPLLATANPSWFAVHISCQSGESYRYGDTACIFPLMSVIKPFSLLYLLSHWGAEQVLQWVGVTPSAMAFNSLQQLIADGGYPRNPMINSGAITLADKLPGKDGSNRTELFCQWLNDLAGCQLYLDTQMLACVRATRSEINIKIAEYLHSTGHIDNFELALDTYEQICCISGTVEDLAKLGNILAVGNNFIEPEHRRIVNAVMLTCGLYEASAEYAVKIGLPMKSGVSGGIIAIAPHQGAIACYSPALDNAGNSVVGLAFLQILTQKLQLSIFL
jgi:glutaminase